MSNKKTRVGTWNDAHPAYTTWKAMMTNCGLRGNSLSEKTRRLYEGRGVTVCPAWREFAVFEEWLAGTGWKRKSGMFVARKDKFKDYCPENCVVVSKTGCENLRSNVVRVNGTSVRDLLGDVPEGRSKRLQIIRQRIHNYRWPVKEALTRETVSREMLTKVHLKGVGSATTT